MAAKTAAEPPKNNAIVDGSGTAATEIVSPVVLVHRTTGPESRLVPNALDTVSPANVIDELGVKLLTS